MTLYALSHIEHGKEDGTRLVLEPGDKITKGQMPDDIIKRLVQRGNVVTYDPTAEPLTADEALEQEAENEELRLKVAQLEAQLEAVQQGGAQANTPSAK
jgi:hypothetical protein